MKVEEKPWKSSCAAGLLAGLLGGEAFLALGLVRNGADLLVSSPSRELAFALIVRSAGLYGLLFAVAGLALAAALHLPWKLLGRERWPAFAVVSAAMTSFIVLAYLTVYWQIDVLAGLPISDADRWSGAWRHVAWALVAGVLVGVVLARLGSRLGAERTRKARFAVVALCVLLATGLPILAGEAVLGRMGDATPDRRPPDRRPPDRRPPDRRPPGRAARVVVAAVDGVCFRVLSPMLRAGRLPAFERLMAEGAWGSLMTYGTASSAQVWTSMATGKRVRDHGIDDFVKVGSHYRAVPFKSTDRKARAVWDVLGEAGRRVAVVDWLITYPPEEVNGYMVSRLHLGARDRTYPPGLEEELEPLLATQARRGRSPREIFLGQIDRAFAVAQELLRREPLDFLAVYEHSTDEVAHQYWKYYEPEPFAPDLWEIRPEEAKRHRSLLPDVLERLDRRLGELLGSLGEDTLLIVISDHGQRAARRPKYSVQLDRILTDLGYAQMKGDAPNKVDHARSRAYRLVETLWKPRLRINLNLTGREPAGIVPRGEAESLTAEIAEALREVRLDDGSLLFGQVKPASFDERPRTATQGADIQVVLSRHLSDGSSLERTVVVGERTYPLTRFLRIDASISGNHDHQGVLFVHGPGVRPGYLGQRAVTTAFQEILWHLTDKVDAVDPLLPLFVRLGLIDRASTLDLTPIVLHALGLPVARDMAGRPRPEIFAGLPEVEWIDTYEGAEADEADGEETPSDEEVLERLRALGYVD